MTELYNLAKTSNPNFALNLHTSTPVTSITPASSGTRRWSLSTPRGSIQCSYVIHATNAYASHLLPHLAGPLGIVPTRGQVIATRANVTLDNLTRSSWDGNEGFEYWFPRPLSSTEADLGQKPLVILGGGRETSGPGFELYQTDDSVVHPDVGRALRNFLPDMFPGRFERDKEPEMEWVCV